MRDRMTYIRTGIGLMLTGIWLTCAAGCIPSAATGSESSVVAFTTDDSDKVSLATSVSSTEPFPGNATTAATDVTVTAALSKSSVTVSHTAATTKETQHTQSGVSIKNFTLFTPMGGGMVNTATPTFFWEEAKGAVTYTLILEQEQDDGSFKTAKQFENITTNRYTVAEALTPAVTYRWRVQAVNGSARVYGTGVEGEEPTFMVCPDYKTHPANQGLNFTFQNTVSKEVLCNYLSRSMVAAIELSDEAAFRENLRMVLNTGAKYLARSDTSWIPNAGEYTVYPDWKERITFAHSCDPELVFEACIFETTSRAVEEIPIPAWVFEEFGLPVEERCFSYEAMLFESGRDVNLWGEDFSVPDMTNLETQMFFYYRACTYIDLGFEGLHMGQIYRIGAEDAGWACWQSMLNRVRAYAKEHARRGFVFINAHTLGMTGPDGSLLFDFHCYPLAAVLPEGAVDHVATEKDPQPMVMTTVNNPNGNLIGRSLGGKTYSGWSCDSLPYFVELDNYCGYIPDQVNKAVDCWGFDQISWFANQPANYRRFWLDYAYNWMRDTDPVGYFEIPGIRTAALKVGENSYRQLTYYCNSSKNHPNGFGDEEAIRNIWIRDRESR